MDGNRTMIVDAAARARQFDILLEVDRVLQGSHYSVLREITYGLADGRIVLEGTVPSWYMKQQAQSIVSAVADSHPIENQIVVERAGEQPERRLRLVAMEQAVPA